MIASYVMPYLLFIFYLFELKTTSPNFQNFIQQLRWCNSYPMSFSTLIANAQIS